MKLMNNQSSKISPSLMTKARPIGKNSVFFSKISFLTYFSTPLQNRFGFFYTYRIKYRYAYTLCSFLTWSTHETFLVSKSILLSPQMKHLDFTSLSSIVLLSRMEENASIIIPKTKFSKNISTIT